VPPEVKETSNKFLPLTLGIVTQLTGLFPVTRSGQKSVSFQQETKKNFPGVTRPTIQTEEEKERK